MNATKWHVLHYNDVHPVNCHHVSRAAARADVARQLRDFRRLGLLARIICRGQQWAIGAEVVRIVCAGSYYGRQRVRQFRRYGGKAVARG